MKQLIHEMKTFNPASVGLNETASKTSSSMEDNMTNLKVVQL